MQPLKVSCASFWIIPIFILGDESLSLIPSSDALINGMPSLIKDGQHQSMITY